MLLQIAPALNQVQGIAYTAIMLCFKLLLLPVVVAISYEINRIVGRYNNFITRIITAPGQWFQNFTTYEPDDGMIEIAIASVKEVIPTDECGEEPKC